MLVARIVAFKAERSEALFATIVANNSASNIVSRDISDVNINNVNLLQE